MSINIFEDLRDRLNPDCFTRGRGGQPILVLVCHNTAGPHDFNRPNQTRNTAQALSDTAARYLTSNDRQASVHWLVGGEACGAPIYHIVPQENTAYHCGGEPGRPSSWKDPQSGILYRGFGLNQVSIGIELLGQPKDVIGPNQQASLQQLVQYIVALFPNLKDPQRIISHASCDPSRTDGENWVKQARQWAGTGGGTVNVTPIQYKVRILRGIAVVRSGPGRNYAPVNGLKADPNKIYQVDGEAHGDRIPSVKEISGFDDVWSRIPEAGGFVTRTALDIVP